MIMPGLDKRNKTEEVCTYIVKIINDTMQELKFKTFIRVTRESAMIYDKLSLLTGMFYYSADYQKIYLYLLFDPNSRFAYHDEVFNYYDKVCEALYTRMRKEINVTVDIVGPGFISDSKSRSTSFNVSRILTPYTVGYWLGMNDQWEFVNDSLLYRTNKFTKSVNVLHVDPNRFDYRDSKELYNLRNEINKSYNCIENPLDVPLAFNEYNSRYESIAGITLPDNPCSSTEDRKIFYVLNATDYFGYDYK